jgi:hypothetical protein
LLRSERPLLLEHRLVLQLLLLPLADDWHFF